MKKLFAEFFGTFWLVFGGCGSALFAASVDLGIGYTGVALAFGLGGREAAGKQMEHIFSNLRGENKNK